MTRLSKSAVADIFACLLDGDDAARPGQDTGWALPIQGQRVTRTLYKSRLQPEPFHYEAAVQNVGGSYQFDLHRLYNDGFRQNSMLTTFNAVPQGLHKDGGPAFRIGNSISDVARARTLVAFVRTGSTQMGKLLQQLRTEVADTNPRTQRKAGFRGCEARVLEMQLSEMKMEDMMEANRAMYLSLLFKPARPLRTLVQIQQADNICYLPANYAVRHPA